MKPIECVIRWEFISENAPDASAVYEAAVRAGLRDLHDMPARRDATKRIAARGSDAAISRFEAAVVKAGWPVTVQRSEPANE